MESIAIGVTVPQKMFTSISASIIMKMLLLFLCNLLSDINDCVNHSCANGAVCVDGMDSYSCNCAMGFTGAYCETGKEITQGNLLLDELNLVAFIKLRFLAVPMCHQFIM